MENQVEKANVRSHGEAGESSAMESSVSSIQFAQAHPEAIAQRKLQAAANQSPQVKQLKSMQAAANNSPQMRNAAQLQANVNAAAPIQRKQIVAPVAAVAGGGAAAQPEIKTTANFDTNHLAADATEDVAREKLEARPAAIRKNTLLKDADFAAQVAAKKAALIDNAEGSGKATANTLTQLDFGAGAAKQAVRPAPAPPVVGRRIGGPAVAPVTTVTNVVSAKVKSKKLATGEIEINHLEEAEINLLADVDADFPVL
jgi:hypothetical protein